MMPRIDFAELTGMRAAVDAMIPRIDVAELTGMRAAVDAMTPRIDVAELTGMRAAVDAMTPRIDVAELTGMRAAVDASVTRIDYQALRRPLDAINRIFGTLDAHDFPSLEAAFDTAVSPLIATGPLGSETADGSTPEPMDLEKLDGVATLIESHLEPVSISRFVADIDPDLVRWAAYLSLLDEPIDADASNDRHEARDDRNAALEAVASVLLAVARQLAATVATLRQGMARVNRAVDVFNEYAARYEKLIGTCIKLAAFLVVLLHLLE